MKVWLNGEFVDSQDAKINVFDHAVLYGDGIFEGIRVYGGKIFKCAEHLDRLFGSAEYIRLDIPYTKAQLTDAMNEAVRVNNRVDAYIRLVVTRGVGDLGVNPFVCAKPSTFIIVDSIALYCEQMYEQGLPVIIAKTVRTSPSMLSPSAKTLNYLNNTVAKIEAVDAGVSEAIMLNADGYVAECTGDNIFFVKDGKVFTPPREAGMLMGITRQVVLDLAADLGIEAIEQLFGKEFVFEADECFLTGTGAEIIAVTKIDDKIIGNGSAGPITQKLLGAFRELIRKG